jgi:glycolate oxidase iron-sulfur subunit
VSDATPNNSRAESSLLPDELYQKSLDCVHCGLCLTSCPTYLVTGRENSSPRGRIYLMRGVAEGNVALGPLLEEEAFLCLGCRACETACPAGVEYGSMLELTREALTVSGEHDGFAARVERFVLRDIVAHRSRLHAAIVSLSWVQALRLDRLAMALLPARASAMLAVAPRVPAAAERAPLPAFTPAEGERRGRVALFSGCIMSEVFGGVHRATIRVLAANGFDVEVPETQGCCGALCAHAGDLETARGLARHNAAVFVDGRQEPLDALIVNSAGCGAAMREAEHWIGEQGQSYASLVRDVCEWLDDVGLRPPRGSVSGTVCYDDPCHLIHAQGVGTAPRRLLASVDGLELVSHDEASACCGAAGIYNLTHPEMSRQVLDRKLDALERVDSDWIATGNPGCAMQIASGARDRKLRAQVVHPIELLAAAYDAA